MGESALARLTASAAPQPESEQQSAVSTAAAADSSSGPSLPVCEHCSAAELSAYAALHRELEDLQSRGVRLLMRSPKHPAWTAGRLLLVHKLPLIAHCALFLRAEPDTAAAGGGFLYSALLLCPPSVSSVSALPPQWRQQRSKDAAVECGELDGRCYVVLRALSPREISLVSSLQLPASAADVTGVLLDRYPARLSSCLSELRKVEAEYFLPSQSWHRLPELDPFASVSSAVKVNVLDDAQLDVVLSASRRQHLQQLIAASPVQSCPQLAAHEALLSRHSLLSDRVERLRACLDDSNLEHRAEYEAKLRLLQRLDFISAEHSVTIKGRVACELNTCDSVIGTELIFDNALGDLEPQQILAVLSCLLFRERNVEPPPLPDSLQLGLDRLIAVCRRVGNASLQCGLQEVESVNEFVQQNVNSGLMLVVQAWAQQTAFLDICQLTEVLEGAIVRNITRLDESCKDVRNAARVIGDRQLHDKMMQASELIRRSAAQPGAAQQSAHTRAALTLSALSFLSATGTSCSRAACICRSGCGAAAVLTCWLLLW